METSSLLTSLKDIMLNSQSLIQVKHFSPENIEVKSKNSLVTEVDKRLEKYFVAELGKLLPESGFIAEEGTSDKKGLDYNWIIDPLDGTTNFIHGIPAYCCSVALMQGREIVLGGILEFNTSEYFEASKDNGAFLNGNRINVSPTKSIEDSLLATGFPYYDFEYIEQYMALFRHLLRESRGLRRLGSAALDLAYVACGRFDGFFEYSLQPWDVAAGIIIVQEAGGRVSDFKGGQNQLFGKQMLASNSFIYNDLLERTKTNFG